VERPKSCPGDLKDAHTGTPPTNAKRPNKSMRKGKYLFSRFLLAFLVWFCIFPGKAQADDGSAKPGSDASRLTQIKRELREKQRSLERLNLEEKRAFERILDLEEGLDLNDLLVRRLTLQQRSVEEELRDKERNLKVTDSTICSYQKSADVRLREIYKHGRPAEDPAALVAFSPADLGGMTRLAQRILKRDAEFLSAADAQRSDLAEGSENLNKMKPRLSRQHQRKDEERSRRLEELDEKERLLRKIGSERRLCLEAIRNLEEEAFSLGLIPGRDDDLAGSGAGGDPEKAARFESQKGKLPWPMPGTVISTFGPQRDRMLHTTTQNSGIEITTGGGAEVEAVADGTVAYSSRLRGYGNFLLLDHGGGYYTLYARLSETLVSPGEAVWRLQAVGRVKQDGSADAPALHFEIRKGRQSLDPLEWLR